MNILASFLFLALACIEVEASTLITATVAVTNAEGTTNGQTITVNGSTRTWTNSVQGASTQILLGTNQVLTASAMLNQFATYPFTGLQLGQTATTNITLAGQTNTVTLSAGWGSVTYTTNAIGSAVVVTMPFTPTAVSAIQVAIGELTVTDFYPHDNGTNFWLDFNSPEYRLSATNDVHLTVSTNWPSTNTASRVSAVLFKGGAADHGLTWNTNWVLLGLTNSSLTIPSNKVARAAFRVDGRGETNVVWGWSVQQ